MSILPRYGGLMRSVAFQRACHSTGIGLVKASKPARELYGDAFVDHYAATREWEEREFRKAITDWELDRYMEII